MKNTLRKRLIPYQWRQAQQVQVAGVDTPTAAPAIRVTEPWPDEFDAFMTDLHLMVEREAFRLSED